MKRILFLFFGLCSYSTLLFSQSYSPPLRIEIETPMGEFPFQLMPMKQHGVILFYETGIVENKQVKWSIVWFDTNLNKITTSDFFIDKGMIIEAFNGDENDFYICMQSKSHRRNILYNTVFVHYNLIEKKIKIYSFNLRDREEVQSMFLFNNTVLFTTLYNKQEEVLLFDLQRLSVKPFYTENNRTYSLQFVTFDSITHSFWIGSLIENQPHSVLVLNQLDTNGSSYYQQEIAFDQQYRLNYCKWVVTDSGKALLLASYVHANEINSKTLSNINTGIVSMRFSKEAISIPTYYNFLYLTNETQLRSNKQDVSLNLQLIVNNVAHNDSLYIFIGEVYYPEYRQEYAAGYGMYAYSAAPTTVFAGYRYQIAYVLVFNKNGNLVWNTQFQHRDILVKSLRNILHAYIDDENNVLLYYGLGSNISSTIINDKTVIQSLDKIPVELLAPGEQIINNYTTFCKHWYADYFIYYGYQTILSPKSNKRQKRKRDVLFINKLVYK